jgi:hypothetical protein
LGELFGGIFELILGQRGDQMGILPARINGGKNRQDVIAEA